MDTANIQRNDRAENSRAEGAHQGSDILSQINMAEFNREKCYGSKGGCNVDTPRLSIEGFPPNQTGDQKPRDRDLHREVEGAPIPRPQADRSGSTQADQSGSGTDSTLPQKPDLSLQGKEDPGLLQAGARYPEGKLKAIQEQSMQDVQRALNEVGAWQADQFRAIPLNKDGIGYGQQHVRFLREIGENQAARAMSTYIAAAGRLMFGQNADPEATHIQKVRPPKLSDRKS